MDLKRHDHTDWLIHFVRNRNPTQDFPGQSELESEHHVGGELERDAEAFEVLKAIIRLGGIKPGYSFRKGRTTIYGGKPAVCVTEMPLHAFATYARERAYAGNVSAYGIAFLKSEFFAAGGRPAIYGLSTENVEYSHKTDTRRIMDETVLPKREQYRYVAHNPKQATRPIDWSHEREWRWVSQDPDLDEVWMKDYDGALGPVPALPIFKGSLEGRSFTKVCILVWSNEEAESIRKLLTGIYLSGHNNYDTPFDTALIRRARIIVLDDVVNAVEKDRAINAQTIEGLEQAKLLQPITIAAAPPNASIIVAQAFSAAQKAAKTADEKYTANYGEYFSGYGYAHITTTDTTDPIVQYLLSAGQASGPFDGEVRINVPGTTGSRDLDRAEAVNTAIADVLAEKLGIDVYIVTRED